MMALYMFEELRFILELIVAEQLFTFHFAPKKRGFYWKTGIGNGFLVIVSLCYRPIIEGIDLMNGGVFIRIFSPCWYIALFLLSLLVIHFCYKITYSDLLFLGIAAYSAQHIVYVLVNEVLAMGIWRTLTEHMVLYVVLCIGSCAVFYWLIAVVFARKLGDCGGVIFEDKWSTLLYFFTLLIVLFASAFMCQHLFLNEQGGGDVNYLGALSDFFNCSLILMVQYSIFRISTLNREKDIVKQLLYERQKQYQLSKENIEIINRKCHDLKHQLQNLKYTDSEEWRQYVNEVEESMMIYDNVLETNNEVLNTILSEKGLYCEKHKIKLACIADAAPLDFMSTMDIYAILGNALDNAIECVSKYKDEEKRVISLNISSKNNFLCIQTNNYYDGQLTFLDGLPVSTKRRNREYHGFGMKSMRHLAEKYGGTLCAGLEDGVFMLQIVIPMPREFARLLHGTAGL